MNVILPTAMLREGTPVEDHRSKFGLLVKREDLSCPAPGPAFSKTRGVFAHVKARPETVIGVLDTYHSQAGHAVARACQLLGKHCVNFYPVYKAEADVIRPPQQRAENLGATLYGLPAGRSAVLYHGAKKTLAARFGADTYMMPNALKLPEMVRETAAEVARTLEMNPVVARVQQVIVPASSATIAAGVMVGFREAGLDPHFLIHMGYSRSHDQVRAYIHEKTQGAANNYQLIDEGYAYKDQAAPGPSPDWPSNSYYDLKAFRWWMRVGRDGSELVGITRTLFWNIG